MDKWLDIANDTLDKCTGIGNEDETKQKLLSITVLIFYTPKFNINRSYISYT